MSARHLFLTFSLLPLLCAHQLRVQWKHSAKYQKSYHYLPKFASYNNAAAYCHELNAELVTISSLQQHSDIRDLLQMPGSVTFHLGARSTRYAVPHEFLDGSNITTYFWYDGQPNDFNSSCVSVFVRASDGSWLDQQCSGSDHIICEKLFSELEPNELLINDKFRKAYIFSGQTALNYSESVDYCAGYNSRLIHLKAHKEAEFIFENILAINIGVRLAIPTLMQTEAPTKWLDNSTLFSNSALDFLAINETSRYDCGSVVMPSADTWLIMPCFFKLNVICERQLHPNDQVYRRFHKLFDKTSGKSYVYFPNVQSTLIAAHEICEQVDAQVIQTTSQKEIAFLSSNLRDRFKSVWLGLASVAKQFNATHFYDGRRVEWFNWDVEPREELCGEKDFSYIGVVMQVDSGRWHYRNTEKVATVVCKKVDRGKTFRSSNCPCT